MKRVAIFMAGGKGERFWPVSTPARPKHLLKIFDGNSLMQLSLKRVQGVAEDVRIVTSRPQEALMRKAVRSLDASKILAEPEARDTAAAVALAARWVQKDLGNDTLIAMLPADHFIKNTRGFRQTLEEAFDVAEKTQGLVTIGIPPTRAATGYGYLQKGEAVGNAFKVTSFKEKPDERTAREYLASGEYLWNAGIFVWSVGAVVKALETHAPEVWNVLKDIDPSNTAQLEQVYPTLKKTSVDYALMEKAQNVLTVPARFDWDDVGEWPAWGRLQEKDAAGNAVQGGVVEGSRETIVFNEDKKHVLAVVGVEGLMVIHTQRATLVIPKAKAQEMKALIKKIGEDAALKKFVE